MTMEFNWTLGLISSAAAFLLILLRRKWAATGEDRQPPAPPGWPLFGNLFNLGAMPHRTVASLATEYGPVVRLKLGSVNTVAILSAKAATELFKNHDLAFLERTITETSRSHDYDRSSLALAPYGMYWRVLRKICTVEMFVAKRINESAAVRRRCVDNMLSWIENEARLAKIGSGVHVAKFVFLTTFNLLGNLMLSRDLADPDSKLASKFFTAMLGMMEWGGHPNISDLYPWLKRFDLLGLRGKMDRDMGYALEIATGWVQERVEERGKEATHDEERRKDFLDIFLAGSETTSSTIEWALTELLRCPEKMTRAKHELASIIGPNQKFEESSIDNLPYLQAIVKEALRLHPPIPFLVPRKAGRDTDFMGYHIPKNTQLFVNAWAIGRDPECWENANLFEPERFLGSKVDYKGQHFELIPFGAGRRMCVGLPLAHRVLHLVLGSLLHEFDWELESGIIADTVDMRDKLGITVRKLEPLKSIPKKTTR
ncbi:cytochrome P450 [Cynara cardunculus var. scolymus]|uniref:Cytochrome P450 n=1 Tax=Cynara cardunculus var. scolymus TaxID=59895 RepID=A0A118JTL0_CYNCS|nr:cytochrome P450 [Cynara cardunculus var. scolymus]